MKRIFIFIGILSAMISCCRSVPVGSDASVSIDVRTVVSTDYVGNGVQWDPYSLDYGQGREEISDSDWEKIYSRLDIMRPSFIRMMMNTRSVFRDGDLRPETGFGHLSRLLDWCQSRGAAVMFGDWGWGHTDGGTVNEPLLDAAAQYLSFLVNEKGYTCIKYYNLINEPNGWWSAANGSYELWSASVRYFISRLAVHGLAGMNVAAPDAAIWGPGEAWWVSRTAEDIGCHVGLYDIHTYPSKCTVNSGEYTDIIMAYKNEVPEGSRIVMGEIGFKFVEEADSVYLQENMRRISKKTHASESDSQMFVYDYMYGTDMADALFQTVNAGFSGCVAWMLDDAMHSNESPDKLKIWGFWNIFGEEIFGAEEEAVRPWFYAWTLLCRYIPAGCEVYETSVHGESSVKAVCAGKDGKKTVAVVNVSKEPKTVVVSSPSLMMSDVCKYIYGEGATLVEGEEIRPLEVKSRVDFSRGIEVEISGESMILWTEMK